MIYQIRIHPPIEMHGVRLRIPNGNVSTLRNVFLLDIHRGDARRASRMFAYNMLRVGIYKPILSVISIVNRPIVNLFASLQVYAILRYTPFQSTSEEQKTKRSHCHPPHAWNRRWVAFGLAASSGVQMYADPRSRICLSEASLSCEEAYIKRSSEETRRCFFGSFLCSQRNEQNKSIY